VDLKVGELQENELVGGKKATVKLIDLKETRDDLRNAVRVAEVTVEIDSPVWETRTRSRSCRKNQRPGRDRLRPLARPRGSGMIASISRC